MIVFEGKRMHTVDNMSEAVKEQAKTTIKKTGNLGEIFQLLALSDTKELGYSEKEIFEAVSIVAYFNYINTLSNTFGLH